MASLKKTALIITIISLICKVFGFLREIVLAYFFGTSYVVDAYLMAVSIPLILFGWLTSISVSFTPIYTATREKKGMEKSTQLTNNILSLIISIAILCILVGLIFNKQIVSFTAVGFKGEVFELTSQYLNISLWIILFLAPVQILIAYLNCNDGFIQSSLANLVVSSTQLLIIAISGLVDKRLLIYGVLISYILHFIVVYIFSRKKNYRLMFELSFTPEIKQIFIIVVPIFISSMIGQISYFIDKAFASSLSEGSIAALNYGTILKDFILTTFSIAITTMIYPMLAQAVAEKNMEKLKDILFKGVNIIIILFIPVTLGSIILAKPAISFVFERGEFGSASTIMTTSAFIMYIIGMLAFALRDVIIKVFYSMQDTKPMLYISAVALFIDIVLNYLLIKPMGHAGLALGTSISAVVTIPMFFVVLRKKIGALGLKSTLILSIKSSLSSLAMCIVVYFGFNWTSGILAGGKLNTLISIIISSGLGALIYFALMILLKAKEIEFFTDMFKKILKRRNE